MFSKIDGFSYVEDSRTIILCVIPANADISTSDGLQMARELDPAGFRTIGVITKVKSYFFFTLYKEFKQFNIYVPFFIYMFVYYLLEFYR